MIQKTQDIRRQEEKVPLQGTSAPRPCIRGVFINAHVRKLRQAKGVAAIEELERRYGRKALFGNLEQVPVREEVKIIDLAFDILRDEHAPPLSQTERSFEAGRLHFRNFSETPFGKILLSAMPHTPSGFKDLLIASRYIVRHIFTNIGFQHEVLAENVFKLTMDNNDYSIEHFRGFFYEWMQAWKLPNATIEACDTTPPFVAPDSPRRYEYTMQWTMVVQQP